MNINFLLVLTPIDAVLNRNDILRAARHSPVTIWMLSALSFFIDTFVYSLTMAILPTILQNNMGVSKLTNGVVTSAFGVASAIASLVTGIISDRIHNRRLLQIFGCLLYVTSGIIFYFARHYYHIVLYRLINGAALGIASTLLFATLGDVYPASLLGLKISVVNFCSHIAYTIGPICGEQLFKLDRAREPALMIVVLGLLKTILHTVAAEDSLTIRKIEQSRQPAEINKDNAERLSKKSNVAIARLLLQLPVVVSALSIMVSMGIQAMLETLIPLHQSDKLKQPDKRGLTFVIFGLVYIIFVPVVGKTNDRLIKWQGEKMRHYIMLLGSITMAMATLFMSFANTYATLTVGFAIFALTNLCMSTPAQSAFEDIINSMQVSAMARGYSIAMSAWSIGTIIMPLIGSALYSRFRFFKAVIGVSAASCALCGIACIIAIFYERMLRSQLLVQF